MSELELGLLLTVAVALGVTALLFLLLRQRRLARRQHQALGLRLLASLRTLLTHIQQHRGLSNGFLKGSRELATDIERLQQGVSRDFSDVAAIDRQIEGDDRWQGITQHWARLAGNYRRLEADNNLAQHNQLIKSILYLIDDVAQRCDLLLLRNQDHKPLHLYWRELLSAAEFIGQARAIGTGVAAASYCDSVSRIRLNYLCGQIEHNTQRLWREIGPGQRSSSEVTRLLECINQHIVSESPSISAGDYFALATGAIDSLLERFDQLLKDQQWQ